MADGVDVVLEFGASLLQVSQFLLGGDLDCCLDSPVLPEHSLVAHLHCLVFLVKQSLSLLQRLFKGIVAQAFVNRVDQVKGSAIVLLVLGLGHGFFVVSGFGNTLKAPLGLLLLSHLHFFEGQALGHRCEFLGGRRLPFLAILLVKRGR